MNGSMQVIYIDELIITFAANFLFDWLLLWATAEVTKTPTSRLRLVAGATLGSFHFALYILATYGVVGHYGLLRFPLTVGLVSLLMLAVTFRIKPSLRKLLRLVGTFYVILSVSAGAGMALGNLFSYGGMPHAFVSNLGAIGALLLVAELGWGVVQRRVWQGLLHVPLEVQCDGKTIEVMALVDTGNHLTDPISRAPVIVIELQPMLELFPEGLKQDVAELAYGDFERISSLIAHSEWSSRLRLIPFSSLGQENGLLLGFKPDRVRIKAPHSLDVPKRVIVGLARHMLDRNGQYQALIHPTLLESVATDKGAPTNSVRTAEVRHAPIQSEKGGNHVVDTSP